MPNFNTTLQLNNSSLEEIITQLNNMPDVGNGLDTSDATATFDNILSGKTAYVDGEKITGNIPTVNQAIPTVTIDTETGLIIATATQTTGYVTGGTKTGTKQLAFQAAQTITPGTTNKTIAANTYLGGVQTIKGDANLVPSNIIQGKSIFGITGTATTGGSIEGEDGLLMGTTTTYTNDRVTTIGSSAFRHCTSLTSVSFPKATIIGTYAFCDCRSLTTVSFPLVARIDGSAFRNCSNLTSVSFPNAITIGVYAFENCSSLTTASFPNVTAIGSSAFYNCSKLTKIYLMNSIVCTLSTSVAFLGTGITSTTGSIFVPASRVASYKSATNWTYFKKRIFAGD